MVHIQAAGDYDGSMKYTRYQKVILTIYAIVGFPAIPFALAYWGMTFLLFPPIGRPKMTLVYFLSLCVAITVVVGLLAVLPTMCFR